VLVVLKKKMTLPPPQVVGRWMKEHPQMKKAFLGMLSTFLLVVSFAVAADEDRILGLWNTAEEDCKIEIFKCGDTYCGRIAWLREPLYPADDGMGMAGRPIVERQNPNPISSPGRWWDYKALSTSAKMSGKKERSTALRAGKPINAK